MLPESSPFTPGQPVPLEFFVGRIAEIERLRSLVRAAAQGRFKISFVTGERGIGKSSLVSFVRHLAEREDSVAGVHVFLGGATGLTDMVRRTFDRLLKESIDKPWYEKVRFFFGNHVRKVGLFGASVELNVSSEDLNMIAQDFVPSLRRLLRQLREERKALMLILDDINGLADSAEFANWLKSTVDQIGTENEPFPVCILIVGLEERRQSLIRLQPSLARVFDVVEIRPWNDEETAGFYRETFEKAAAIGIDEQALSEMKRFTGGLPVLAQEIGDAVWRSATSPVITVEAARAGIVNAAEIVGHKFLQPQVIEAIRSPRYRSILRKIVVEDENSEAGNFQRSEVSKKLTAEEIKVLDNFLGRMKKLGAVATDNSAGPGWYKFANELHRLYFLIEALRTK
jgi:AAA+ ATPase superfamily predicted ATPase